MTSTDGGSQATRTSSGLDVDDTAPRLHPTLVVAHHPIRGCIGASRTFTTRDQLAIGRGGHGMGMGVFEDSRLSKQHALVECRDHALSVCDRGSRNGTWVNGHRIEDWYGLMAGDVLSVGSLLMVVTMRPSGFEPERVSGITCHSAALSMQLTRVRQVASAVTPVLIGGETGTGKELVARELHRASGRSGPFLAINCGGLDGDTVRSELFGYVKGAFTGATSDRAGLVEQAHRGTLLLDEIGDAPPRLQAMLLRVLQERQVRRVGSTQPIGVDTRFAAASCHDLAREVAKGRFREDLYARLEPWTIRVPALRDRREDILPVAREVAREVLGRSARFSRKLAHRLLVYDWPRNVRELRGVVEQVAIEQRDAAELLLTPALSERLPLPDHVSTPKPQRRRRSRPTRASLQEGLRAADGNVSRYAASLGVSRMTVYRWLEREGLNANDLRGDEE